MKLTKQMSMAHTLAKFAFALLLTAIPSAWGGITVTSVVTPNPVNACSATFNLSTTITYDGNGFNYFYLQIPNGCDITYDLLQPCIQSLDVDPPAVTCPNGSGVRSVRITVYTTLPCTIDGEVTIPCDAKPDANGVFALTYPTPNVYFPAICGNADTPHPQNPALIATDTPFQVIKPEMMIEDFTDENGAPVGINGPNPPPQLLNVGPGLPPHYREFYFTVTEETIEAFTFNYSAPSQITPLQFDFEAIDANGSAVGLPELGNAASSSFRFDPARISKLFTGNTTAGHLMTLGERIRVREYFSVAHCSPSPNIGTVYTITWDCPTAVPSTCNTDTATRFILTETSDNSITPSYTVTPDLAFCSLLPSSDLVVTFANAPFDTYATHPQDNKIFGSSTKTLDVISFPLKIEALGIPALPPVGQVFLEGSGSSASVDVTTISGFYSYSGGRVSLDFNVLTVALQGSLAGAQPLGSAGPLEDGFIPNGIFNELVDGQSFSIRFAGLGFECRSSATYQPLYATPDYPNGFGFADWPKPAPAFLFFGDGGANSYFDIKYLDMCQAPHHEQPNANLRNQAEVSTLAESAVPVRPGQIDIFPGDAGLVDFRYISPGYPGPVPLPPSPFSFSGPLSGTSFFKCAQTDYRILLDVPDFYDVTRVDYYPDPNSSANAKTYISTGTPDLLTTFPLPTGTDDNGPLVLGGTVQYVLANSFLGFNGRLVIQVVLARCPPNPRDPLIDPPYGGYDSVTARVQAICDGCVDCAYTTVCLSGGFYRHCTGPCVDPDETAPPQSTASYSVQRVSLGMREADHTQPVVAGVDDISLGFGYPCDVFDVKATGSIEPRAGNQLAFRFKYGSAPSVNYQFFDYVPGSGTLEYDAGFGIVTLPIPPGDLSTVFPPPSSPPCEIGWDPCSPSTVNTLYVNFTDPTLVGLMQSGSSTISLTLKMRIKVKPMTGAGAPAPGKYVLTPFEGQFWGGTGAGQASCDPYNADLTVFNVQTVYNCAILPANYANQQLGWPFTTGVCERRFFLITSVVGGAFGHNEFKNEYRPVDNWNNPGNPISMTLPPGVYLTSADFAVLQRTPFYCVDFTRSGSVPSGQTVTFNGYHASGCSGQVLPWEVPDRDGLSTDLILKGTVTSHCPATQADPITGLTQFTFPFFSQEYSTGPEGCRRQHLPIDDPLGLGDLRSFPSTSPDPVISLTAAVTPLHITSTSPTVTGLKYSVVAWPGATIDHAFIKVPVAPLTSPNFLITTVNVTQNGTTTSHTPDINGYVQLGSIPSGLSNPAHIALGGVLIGCQPGQVIPIALQYGFACDGYPGEPSSIPGLPIVTACTAQSYTFDVVIDESDMAMSVFQIPVTDPLIPQPVCPCENFYRVRLSSIDAAAVLAPGLAITVPPGMGISSAAYQTSAYNAAGHLVHSTKTFAGCSHSASPDKVTFNSVSTVLPTPTATSPTTYFWDIDADVYSGNGMPPGVAYVDLIIGIQGCAANPTFKFHPSGFNLCGGAIPPSPGFADVIDTYPIAKDTVSPVFSGCPIAPIVLPCNTPPTCAMTASLGIKATDACSGPIPATCLPGPIVANGCQRSQVFTLTASDPCGNAATCQVTYHWIEDLTGPSLTVPTTGLDLGCNPVTLPNDTSVAAASSATDACGGTTVSVTHAADSTVNGVTTRDFTVTAKDPCLNTTVLHVVYTWKVNCATNCCDNCVAGPNGQYPASYTITVYPGFNALVNQLCRGTNNLLTEVLANDPSGSIPADTQVIQWNEATQTYGSVDVFDGMDWLDNATGNPTTTVLKPGDGFMLFNPGPAYQLTFSGCEPTCPPPCGPTNGMWLVGRIGTGTPTYYTNLFSCPPQCGTRMSVFNPQTQIYDLYDYVNGVWTPPEPGLLPGQAAWFEVLPNTNCCRITCANDKTVPCGQPWHFDPPTASSGCCSNLTFSLVSSNVVNNNPCQSVFNGVWQVTDCDHQITTCTQAVTVVDITPPVLTCPTSIKRIICGDRVRVFFKSKALDACDPSVNVSCSPASGSIFHVGTTTVTCTSTDDCGNTATCSFPVTVVDQSFWQWFPAGAPDCYAWPYEPSYRGPCLNNAHPTATWKGFDDPTVNRQFGHTWNLPPFVTYLDGKLFARMKDYKCQGGSLDDRIRLGLKGCIPGSPWAWTRKLGSPLGLYPGSWCNLSGCNWLFQLPLNALPQAVGSPVNIMPHINAPAGGAPWARRLDLLVEDDTRVDFAWLSLRRCAPNYLVGGLGLNLTNAQLVYGPENWTLLKDPASTNGFSGTFELGAANGIKLNFDPLGLVRTPGGPASLRILAATDDRMVDSEADQLVASLLINNDATLSLRYGHPLPGVSNLIVRTFSNDVLVTSITVPATADTELASFPATTRVQSIWDGRDGVFVWRLFDSARQEEITLQWFPAIPLNGAPQLSSMTLAAEGFDAIILGPPELRWVDPMDGQHDDEITIDPELDWFATTSGATVAQVQGGQLTLSALDPYGTDPMAFDLTLGRGLTNEFRAIIPTSFGQLSPTPDQASLNVGCSYDSTPVIDLRRVGISFGSTGGEHWLITAFGTEAGDSTGSRRSIRRVVVLNNGAEVAHVDNPGSVIVSALPNIYRPRRPAGADHELLHRFPYSSTVTVEINGAVHAGNELRVVTATETPFARLTGLHVETVGAEALMLSRLEIGPITDADGDGMPDDWELAHGFNPHESSDADEDADGDGLTNLQEFLGHTDPRSPEPLRILEQPTAQTVPEGEDATFTVVATGVAPLGYQWRKNGTEVPGATDATLTLGSVSLLDHGSMVDVIVRDTTGALTSAAVSLSVQPDNQPPQLVSATGDASLRQITLRFSERIDAGTALDSFNYAISGGIEVLNVSLGTDGMSVVLDTTSQTEDTAYTVTTSDLRDSAGNSIQPNPASAAFRSFAFSAGFLRFEAYEAGPGSAVSNLVQHPTFPDSPSERLFLTAWDTRTVRPDDSRENYGSRISGFFIPPNSGNWIFYLRSADASELHLSPDGDSSHAIKIIEEAACCHPFSAHASAPQSLVAGQRYFIESLSKAGIGADYCQVAAKLETDPADPDTLRPISGGNLGSYVDPTCAQVAIVQPPVNLSVPDGCWACFSVDATGVDCQGQPAAIAYEWQRNGVAITDANGPSYCVPATTADHRAQYRVIVRTPGASATSPSAVLSVGPGLPGITLSCPSSQSTNINGTNVVINYAAPAVTNGTLQRCTPASGSLFPLGTTVVTCIATNACGAGSCSFSVSARQNVAPVIQVHPISQDIVIHGQVTLSVTVDTNSTLPLGYLWRRNNATVEFQSVSNHVSFLTLTNLLTNDTYRVAVTNLARPGGALSSPALITVRPDLDHDGLPDDWELSHFGSATGSNPSADTDGDGMTNLQEYNAGTDPTNAVSFLSATLPPAGNAGTPQVGAVAGRTYTIQRADILSGSAWTKLTDLPAHPTNRVVTVSDESRPGTNRFYRVLTPRQP